MSETTILADPVAPRPAGKPSRPKRPNVVGKFGFKLAEPPSEDEKDVLTPVLVGLSKRYVAKARDENELDMVFRSALARHPEIPASLIEKFVEDFEYIPTQAKDTHFAMSVLAGPAGAPLDISKVAKTAAGRNSPRPWGVVPKVESLNPPQPRYGYIPGQQVTAIGLFGGAGHNAVEIWMFDPDNVHKVWDIRPVREETEYLTFCLPADITPGMWHLRAVVDAEYESDFLVIHVAAPGIVVTNIENAGQQPGTDIIITGQNVQPSVRHKVTFTSMDIPPPDSVPAVAEATPVPSQPTTQMVVRIPSSVLTGNNQVQVSIDNNVTPPSNILGYVVGVPQYHLTFLKMHCYDETNWGGTEWGEDELKTLWTVVADGAVWSRKSNEYSFDEGDKPEQSYTPEDGGCAFKDGQFGEIRYGLAIVTGLYETEGADITIAQGFLDIAGQVGAAIVTAVGYGQAAAAAVKAISAGLAKLTGWVFDDTVTVGYDGSRPAHPGPIKQYWSALDLQKLLPKRNSETGIRTLNMHGDGDHGWYNVTYKIARN